VNIAGSGRIAVITTNMFAPQLPAAYAQAGVRIRDIQHMTLEEIFVAEVMGSRGEYST
jgi:hypothetical protein